jgi:hypothetical protein
MKTNLILLFLFAVCLADGHCETWNLYYGNSEYYDEDSIVSPGPVRSVWLKSTALDKRARAFAGETANYGKFAVEVNCGERTLTTLGSYFYNSSDRLVKKSIPTEGTRKQIPIMPRTSYGYETKEEYLFEAVCREAPK